MPSYLATAGLPAAGQHQLAPPGAGREPHGQAGHDSAEPRVRAAQGAQEVRSGWTRRQASGCPVLDLSALLGTSFSPSGPARPLRRSSGDCLCTTPSPNTLKRRVPVGGCAPARPSTRRWPTSAASWRCCTCGPSARRPSSATRSSRSTARDTRRECVNKLQPVFGFGAQREGLLQQHGRGDLRVAVFRVCCCSLVASPGGRTT